MQAYIHIDGHRCRGRQRWRHLVLLGISVSHMFIKCDKDLVIAILRDHVYTVFSIYSCIDLFSYVWMDDFIS